MKEAFILISLILIILFANACDGEKEIVIIKHEQNIQQEPLKTANYQYPKERFVTKDKEMFDENITGLEEKLKYDNGYILTGSFDLNSLSQNDKACIGLIKRKREKGLTTYIFEDCDGNKVTLEVRK